MQRGDSAILSKRAVGWNRRAVKAILPGACCSHLGLRWREGHFTPCAMEFSPCVCRMIIVAFFRDWKSCLVEVGREEDWLIVHLRRVGPLYLHC